MKRSIFRKTAVLCLTLLCMAAISASAAAVVIPVAPSGDGALAYSQVTSNSPTMELHDYIVYDPWYGLVLDDLIVGVIKIPIASLSGMNLTGASITLNYYQISGQVQLVYGGRFDGNGVVSLDDHNSFNSGKTCVSEQLTPVGSAWQSVDVASYVRNQLASGYSWANFRMEIPHESTTFIAAAEDTQGRGAYLNVVPVPEPSSLMALMGGLAGLVASRKGRVKSQK